jgi:murein L,D-transpeptidase YafK
LIRATLVRALLLSAAFACSLTPIRCLGEDGNQLPTKATKELSPEVVSLLQQKSMPKHSPILVRIFKEESELEVWKQDTSGRFQLFKVYAICRWSGDLGPKINEGDRQAPEGFYTITQGLMNPNSNYYLAINIGFPNAFDRANEREGSFLMIHGDCSSSGCYAMTDEQIGEIYSLARESFLGDQPSFQIQAYPFRMTPTNLAHHRTNPHMAFWKMLKIGNDHFEATHLEPKVEVCDRRYVFDAQQPPNSSNPLVLDPTSKCPALVDDPKIARPAREKQNGDEIEYAQLVEANVSVAPIQSGLDGGMNKVFLAQFPGRILLARAPGSQMPQLPPVPWVDNDGLPVNKLFGAPFELKSASPTQIASTESATQERGAASATTGSTAAPTTTQAPAAAKPKSGEPRKNDSVKNGAPTNEPQAFVVPPTAIGNSERATNRAPADFFDARWGALQ